MTVIDKLESKERKIENFHHKKLIEGLDNEPYNYEWTGVVIDSKGSQCTCGHEIRWKYPLRHKETGKIVIVGSVCVGTYQILDEKTTQNILKKAKEIQSEIRKKKAEAKKLSQQKEIIILIKERKPLLKELENIVWLYEKVNEFQPYNLYTYKAIDSKKYIRLSSCIKALKKDIQKIKSLIEEFIKNKKLEEFLNRIISREFKCYIGEQKWLADREKEEARLAKLQFIGKIGERSDFEVTLIDGWLNRTYETWIYKFQDKKGNIIIKWGLLTSINFIVGKTYSFSAEVRKHSEWEREKSTTITRLKNIKKKE